MKPEFSFLWWIESCSYCLKNVDDVLSSPNLTPKGFYGTSWDLFLKPWRLIIGLDDSILLKRSSRDFGPKSFLVNLEISVMKEDGSILYSEECKHTFRRGDERGFNPLLDVHHFVQNNAEYLPGDTLGMRCRMWKGEGTVQIVRQCTARTRAGIEKISFLHRVKNFSALKLGEKKVLRIPSHSKTGCAFTSTLYLDDKTWGKNGILVEISPSLTNYLLRKMRLSLINVSGNIIELYKYDYPFPYNPVFHYFARQFILDKREEYLPNDALSLLCEYTFRTGECHVQIEEILHYIPESVFKQRYDIPHSKNDGKAAEKLSAPYSAPEDSNGIYNQMTNNDRHKNTFNAAEKLSMCPSALDDFTALYIDELLTDVVLKTATKSFPAHRNLLCARSSVFRAMFANDMKEKNTDCIKVEDLENETVQRFLLFLCSDGLEELQWESAIQLYYAADKYAIERLKVLCSSFLADNLSTPAASELLLLADTHNDTDLKTFVEDFIFEHEEEVFCSVEWGKLNERIPHLVMKTIQLKYKREKGTHNSKERTKNYSNNIYNSAEKLSKCPSALDDFKTLYNDQFLTDIMLTSATKSFPDHKTVLCARSSVFRAMLTDDMKEKNTACIKVEDLENETVQHLLLFLYSDSLEELQWESAIQLYYAADKYAIEKLKVLCSSFLIDNLNTSTASEFLLLADTHNDTQLKKIAEDFILKNEEEVFGSEEWEKLIETNPQLVIKTMHLKYKKRKEEVEFYSTYYADKEERDRDISGRLGFPSPHIKAKPWAYRIALVS
ncbi:unnamed protein product [Larinioides sclopetarius]|uniref:BTB domain-containing protein n=1 Tax=Larinioides sclopetarius TaxID=280406 RepID=A0AAV2ACX4_9ARAC